MHFFQKTKNIAQRYFLLYKNMLYNIKIVFHFRKWNKKLQKRYFLLRIFCTHKVFFVTLPRNSRTMLCNLKQPHIILNNPIQPLITDK